MITRRKKALVIPVTGDTKVVEFDDGTEYNVLHEGIGGGEAQFLEAVSLPSCTLWIDEEGKLKDLPYNPRADGLSAGIISPWDHIVGDAVVTGVTGEDGYTTSAPDWVFEMFE